MAVKFVMLKEDPYTNSSSLFILILGINALLIPTPTAPGTSTNQYGLLYDPQSTLISYYIALTSQDYEVTGSLSDEAFAHSYVIRQPVVIPPGWSFHSFTYAYGIQGTLEELAPFIRGM